MAADWDKIRTEYIAGGITLREIVDKYGVSFDTLKKRASREKWNDNKHKAAQEVAQKVRGKVVQKKVDRLTESMDALKTATEAFAETLGKLSAYFEQSPELLVASPQMVSAIANGLDKQFDLLRKMAGIHEAQEKIKIERERLKLEKKRYEDEIAEKARAIANAGTEFWKVEPENEQEAEDIGG